jgi:hypothetical protein
MDRMDGNGSDRRFVAIAVGLVVVSAIAGGVSALGEIAYGQGGKPMSFTPVVINESVESVMSRLRGEKTEVMRKQQSLLNER